MPPWSLVNYKRNCYCRITEALRAGRADTPITKLQAAPPRPTSKRRFKASRSPGGVPSAEDAGDCVSIDAGIGQAGRREHGHSVSVVEEQGGGHARRISGAGEAGAGATARGIAARTAASECGPRRGVASFEGRTRRRPPDQ